MPEKRFAKSSKQHETVGPQSKGRKAARGHLVSSQDSIDHGKEVLKTSKEEIARKASYQSPIDKWQFIKLSPNWMIRVTKSHPVCLDKIKRPQRHGATLNT